MSASENCQDGFQYSVSTTKSSGEVKTTSYCKGGTVSHLDLLGETTVTVDVPKEEELDQTVFNVKVAPRGERHVQHPTLTCSNRLPHSLNNPHQVAESCL